MLNKCYFQGSLQCYLWCINNLIMYLDDSYKSNIRKILSVFGSVSAILILPYLGAYIKYHSHFPDDYFDYPPVISPPKADNSMTFELVLIGIGLLILMVYVFPAWFGFKKTGSNSFTTKPRMPFPIWGWIGMVMWVGTLILLWGHFQRPKFLIHWAYIPMFWGFTLLLDAVLFMRDHTKSMVFNNPREMIAIGVAAMGGWMLFEYLNFFVRENWIYPFSTLMPKPEFLIYAIAGSSGLMPVIFVIYRLLGTLPGFSDRYRQGISINPSSAFGTILLIFFFTSMFLVPFFPNQLFGMLWISPMCIMVITLHKIGEWTPISPLKWGDWAPLMKYTLTYLIYGLFLECMNYFSGIHHGDTVISYTTAYWQYSIPYVNFWHVFEMPIVGFIGYLPFGIYCSAWWISFAYLLNIPSSYKEDETISR